MSTKTVKFFRPVLVHQDGSREDPNDDFWSDAHTVIAGLDSKERGINYRAASYFGEAGTGSARAYQYIRVGRVRYRADWPETIDPNGHVDELNLDGRDIFEGGYVVPFGTETRVAVIGPIRGLVSVNAIEWWLGQTLGLANTDVTLELVPEVDPALARKLNEAIGVSRLSVRMPKGTALNLDVDSQVEEAFATAHEASGDDLNVDIAFSFGHQRPQPQKASMLQKAARKIAESGAAERVDVSLMLDNGDGGYTVEQHELIRDRVAVTVEFNVEDDSRLSTDEILDAVHTAITKFRAR
ncbi:hypothetical protein IDH50_11245 [Aeromicrobium tamlense]|uniref:Uncharacterized protein n=1 Tax=Aeromicrobium tamlense TaxID=375541 RepID=A0A8I0FUJ6_9ACTN|nr:hypothetical protein [Aeromicrobium tamlense]MBD1270809.1 hypothetical protein [Aeromicrobium tamlense]NYI38201.1 hypothetical protein [Aeromicrobium tamlense]